MRLIPLRTALAATPTTTSDLVTQVPYIDVSIYQEFTGSITYAINQYLGGSIYQEFTGAIAYVNKLVIDVSIYQEFTASIIYSIEQYLGGSIYQEFTGAIAYSITATLWTPTYTTTKLWLDFADASTITVASGIVTQANDKSGNSKHAYRTSTSSNPVIASASLNGLNGISFNGSTDFLETTGYAAVNNASSDTVFLVVSQSSGTSRYGIAGTRGSSGGDVSKGWILSYFSSSINPIAAFIAVGNASSSGTNRGADINGFIKNSTTFQIVTLVNTISSSTSGALLPVTGANCTQIGREQNGATTEFGAITVWEIIEVDTSDTALIEKLKGYLAWKYGLQSNLPSGHPYKIAAPTV
jgi:hypothetical protein